MEFPKFEIIEIKNKFELLKLMKKFYIIGFGNTSICFRISNKYILKLYKDSNIKKDLFSRFNMKEHIKELSQLNNSSFIAPVAMLIYKDEVIGYITEYKKAKTLKNLTSSTTIDQLLFPLERLIEDTYKISEKGFHLEDLRKQNLLFHHFYYVIDLDYGKFEKFNSSFIFDNISMLMKTILEAIFKVSESELLIIDYVELFNLYNDAIYRDYKKIYDFMRLYKEIMHTDQLNVRKLRRSLSFHTEVNTYYRNNFF